MLFTSELSPESYCQEPWFWRWGRGWESVCVGGIYIYVSNTTYADHYKDSALNEMGSSVSHVKVLLLVRQKFITLEEKGELNLMSVY